MSRIESITLPRIEQAIDDFVALLPCRDRKPYPPSEVTRPDQKLGMKLLDAYANGPGSELTAVTQYTYHAFTNTAKQIGNLQFAISLVEMKHLELLADTIKKLGVDPQYHRANRAFWSGGGVSYGEKPCEKLLLDRDAENAAIDGYERLINDTSDPLVRRTLQRILDDELVHLRFFNDALSDYCGY